MAIVCAPVALKAGHDFKLSDFNGDFITTIESIGVPYESSLGTVSNLPYPSSANIIVRSTMDKDGNGKVTFLSGTLVEPTLATKPPNTNRTLTCPKNGSSQLITKLTLINKKEGTGTLIFYDLLSPGHNVETAFVATKHKGKVVKLYQNATVPIQYLGAPTISTVRQFKD
jgi:hypothetical protein